jgi:hypothetical protein
MARCPVCLRKVSPRELFRQLGFVRYRCMRCGRSWRFSLATIAISFVFASGAALALAFSSVLETAGFVAGTGAGLTAFCSAFCVLLLTIGRLVPPTR